jgi:hypothetical protein
MRIRPLYSRSLWHALGQQVYKKSNAVEIGFFNNGGMFMARMFLNMCFGLVISLTGQGKLVAGGLAHAESSTMASSEVDQNPAGMVTIYSNFRAAE